MIDDEEVLQAREKFIKSIQTFLQKFSRYPFRVMPKVLLIAWERYSEIKHAFTDKQYTLEEFQELMCKLLEDVQNINEELSKFTNSLSWDRPMIADDEEHSIQFRLYLENSSKAIAPVLPTDKSEYSLSMGNKNLDTIPETKSNKLIKSSVENLVPIPSEYEVTFDNEKIVDTIVESLSPSPIIVKDGDSHMEEIDLFLATDDLMPPVVMNNIDELIEDECFDPGVGEIDVFKNVEDDDYFPFIFVIQNFLLCLIYPEVSPLLLSTESEDTIFDLGIST
nr:hypothetical protein [Tanacetum cinerariifolium]